MLKSSNAFSASLDQPRCAPPSRYIKKLSVLLAAVFLLVIGLLYRRHVTTSADESLSAMQTGSFGIAKHEIPVIPHNDRAEPPGDRTEDGEKQHEDSGLATRSELIVSLIREAETTESVDARAKAIRDLDDALIGVDFGVMVRALPFDAFNTLWGAKVLEGWVRQNRCAAAEWLAHYPRSDMAQAVVLMNGWLDEDPAGMRRYLENLPAGYWKQEVMKAAIWEAVSADNLVEAIGWARQLGSDDNSEGALLPALLEITTSPSQ